MAVNLPKITDTPYLSLYCNSTKQNDNVTMTFPVNSSLQCFRTAALSMVTLKYGVTKSYGACECRKSLKNVKILRCQWVKLKAMCKYSANSEQKNVTLKSHLGHSCPELFNCFQVIKQSLVVEGPLCIRTEKSVLFL